MPPPNSPHTRAAARQNALTHGLRTADIIVPGEHRQHWRHFYDLMMEELAPETPFERELAANIATLIWRLRRVPRAESWLTGIKDDDKRELLLEFQRIAREIESDRQ
jgi:hypothetical protein